MVPGEFARSHDEVIAIYEKHRDTKLAAFLARDNDSERREEKFKTLLASLGDKVLEGAIVKPLDGLYELKRTWGWMKLKAEETEDLRVVGVFEGEGRFQGMLGGLIVDRNGVSVRVGGGFSDEQRRELWSGGVKVCNRLIEVEFHEVIKETGSLRHPRFLRFRDDLPNPYLP
jgi:ATP-dependent DNA ligase